MIFKTYQFLYGRRKVRCSKKNSLIFLNSKVGTKKFWIFGFYDHFWQFLDFGVFYGLFGFFWIFFWIFWTFFWIFWDFLIFWIFKICLVSFKVTKVSTKSYHGYYWTPKIAKNGPKQQQKKKPRPKAEAIHTS